MDFIILIQQILYEFHVQQKTYHELITRFSAFASLHTSTFHVRKLIHKFKLNITSNKRKIRKIRTQLSARQLLDIRKLDIYNRTGLFEHQFEHLYQQIKHKLSKPRTGKRFVKRTLSPRVLLLMNLHFLRENLKYKTLSSIYHIDSTTVKNELYFTIPILYCNLRGNISWPNEFVPHLFWHVCGAIDCTPHFRKRVHPGSLEYYRGDYKDYFLSAQLIVSLQGLIWNVHLGLGGNNDMGMLKHSKVDTLLENWKIYLLADRGYVGSNLITPRDMADENMNQIHKRLRSIVEKVFGFIKNWEVAAGRFRLSPEAQRISLMIIYQLAALIMKEFPLL
jgi:hypothetical protein